jgi:hypothetical protein
MWQNPQTIPIKQHENENFTFSPFMDDEARQKQQAKTKSGSFDSFAVIFNLNLSRNIWKTFPIFFFVHIRKNVFLIETGEKKINRNFLCLIISDCTFTVEIIKGPRGLGLSVSGGIDSSAPYPGLVRIKRLFPHQAAWATGKLQTGDILLEANGIILTGLTNNVSKVLFSRVMLLFVVVAEKKYS